MPLKGSLSTPMNHGFGEPGTGGNEPGDHEGTSLVTGVPTKESKLDSPMYTGWGKVGTMGAKDLPGLQITQDVQGIGMAAKVPEGNVTGPNPRSNIRK